MKRIFFLFLFSTLTMAQVKFSDFTIRTLMTTPKYIILLDSTGSTSQKNQRVRYDYFLTGLENRNWSFRGDNTFYGRNDFTGATKITGRDTAKTDYVYRKNNHLYWRKNDSTEVALDSALVGSVDTTLNYHWTGIHIYDQDSIKINGLWYDFPATRIANSVLWDSLGDGILKWKEYVTSAFDTTADHVWSGVNNFTNTITTFGSETGNIGTLRLHNSANNFHTDIKSGEPAGDIVLTTPIITGTLGLTSIAGGGTNATTFTAGKYIFFDGTRLKSSGKDSLSFVSKPDSVNLSGWASNYKLSLKQNLLTTGNLTENITGLQFDNTRQVIGGAATLSLTAGYVIPTTTEQTNWGTAYTNTHTHSNKAILDSINVAFTLAKLGQYNVAYTNRITSLTTTGSSGAATLLSNTLNIPNYTLAGLGGVSGSGTTNELAYWTGASSLGTLAVASYPSLTEISYVKGVTSSIQSQLNGKAATLSGTSNEIAYFNSASTIASLAVASYPSLTELSYVKGVTSAIQSQFTGKLSTALTNTYLFVGNGSNVATGVAMSGDATITNLGAVAVANDSHDHTGSTISGLAVADFTSPNISNWTNDASYTTLATVVGANNTWTGTNLFTGTYGSYRGISVGSINNVEGVVRFNASSNYYGDLIPAVLGANRVWTLPDATGTLALTSQLTSGTVTSIATTSPITGGTITSTGTIGIQVANTSQSGYLTNTDWNTFNGKTTLAAVVAANNTWTGTNYFNGPSVTFGASTAFVTPKYSAYGAGSFWTDGTVLKYRSDANDLYTVATTADLSSYVPTSRTISTTSPLSGGGALSGNLTLSIADAAADGSTKGAASFTANDFDATSGNIGIDYVNGQKASGSVNGFVSTTTQTFAGKKTFNNPVVVSDSLLFTDDFINPWEIGNISSDTLDASTKTSIAVNGGGDLTTIIGGVEGKEIMIVNINVGTQLINETGNLVNIPANEIELNQYGIIRFKYYASASKWICVGYENN